MKKFLSGGKLWTILSALIFFATFGLVVYAQSSTISGIFDKYKTNTLGNELKANDWNNLMNDLNGLFDDMDKLEIPEGAVMAFEGECPEGWTPYELANGRFVLGAGNGYNIGDIEGNSEITLKTPQLPAHYHYIARFTDYSAGTNYFVCGGEGNDGQRVHKSRATYQSYYLSPNSHCSSNYDLLFQRPIDSTLNDPTLYEPNGGKTNTVGNGSPINIMPPYITLQYCIKGASNVTVPCQGNYPTGVRLGKSTSNTIKNWKWATGTEPGECEYVCAEGYIKEGDKCINYTSSEWCCTNYNDSKYGIACYNWRIDPIDTVDDKYCERNREEIGPKPTNSKAFCGGSSNSTEYNMGIDSRLYNPPFCPGHQKINTNPGIGNIGDNPGIGYPGRDMY